MLAWRPPYDWPPMKPSAHPRWRRAWTASASPSRSLAASPGPGGPCGRDWRKGRSQRNTAKWSAANWPASATSSAEFLLPPAPWVSTRPRRSCPSMKCNTPETDAAWTVSVRTSDAMPVGRFAHVIELFIDRAGLDQFGEADPESMHLGIFMGFAASGGGSPVPQQQVL